MTTRYVRFHDWPERLAAYIESRRRMPFQWGTNDCATFSADGVLAMTGIDPAPEGLRGYTTEEEARDRIARFGGVRGLALATGLVERPLGLAQRGDVVIAMPNERETFGLISDGVWWCTPGPGNEGLVFRPMSDVRAVFGF